MTTKRTTHASERGNALLVVMVLTIVAMGLIMALSTLVHSASNLSENRVDYAVSLEVPEMALHQALRQIQASSVDVSGDEYLGFVEADLDPGSTHTRTVWGTVNGVDYLVTITSAYQYHYDDNVDYDIEASPAPSLEPSDGYLTLVPKGYRSDADHELFDYYHVVSYVTQFQRDTNGNILLDGGSPARPVLVNGGSATDIRGIGRHNFRRGVEAVLKLTKYDIKSMIPSALYIDGDPDPKLTGHICVSGADHPMKWEDAQGGAAECPDCQGIGVVPADPANPVPCPDCGGDGLTEIDCATCGGIGRTQDCATCLNAGEIKDTCPECDGCGRKTNSGAPGTECKKCGGAAPGCKFCDTICLKCAGTGEVMTDCPDCAVCPDCNGDGTEETTCVTCNGTGSGEADQTACATCGGDGLVAADFPNGQVDEVAWRDPNSTNDKPAVQYPGTYDQLTGGADVDWTALVTEDASGNEQTGAAATSTGDIDLRMLAEAFVGDLDSPDLNRLDNAYGVDASVDNIDTLKKASDDGILGDTETFKITYYKGDADTVAGVNGGGGVLIVNGDLHISGKFKWYGLVIVLGETRITGGGNDKHIFGSLMGAEFIDDTNYEEFDMTGNADIFWCQEAIDKVMKDLNPTFKVYPIFEAWKSIDKGEIMAFE